HRTISASLSPAKSGNGAPRSRRPASVSTEPRPQRRRVGVVGQPALSRGRRDNVSLDPAGDGREAATDKENPMLKRMSAAAAATIALTAVAAGEEWPNRPITLVVPFAAGGGIDTSARIQAQRMAELLGQTIVVENVGAAAGMAGGQRVAK